MSTKPIHTVTELKISDSIMLISQLRMAAALKIYPEAYILNVALKGKILLTA